MDFASISKQIAAPYMQMVSSYRIENENTTQQKIHLRFDNEGYSVHMWWDRLFIRSDYGFDNFGDPSSAIVEPFLNIYKKIKENKAFGKNVGSLFYSLVVKNQPGGDFEQIVADFKNTYFTKKVDNIVANSDDYAITSEKKINKKLLQLTFGPYSGIADLQKRNILINQAEATEYVHPGIMAEIKINGTSSEISFKYYKELIEMSKSLLDKI